MSGREGALFAENFMHEISGVPGAELLQQIGSMEINGARADAERTCGLLAGGTPDDLSQHNTLSWSQSVMSGERFRQGVQRAVQPPDFLLDLAEDLARRQK